MGGQARDGEHEESERVIGMETLGVGFLLLGSFMVFSDVTLALKCSDHQKAQAHWWDAGSIVAHIGGAFLAGLVFLKIWSALP